MSEYLMELARRDFDHACKLYDPNRYGYMNSVLDGINARVYRIRASAYVALAEGMPAEQVLEQFGEQARAAARDYNTVQEKLYSKHTKSTANVGIAGYFGEDEAYMRILHAVNISKSIRKTAY